MSKNIERLKELLFESEAQALAGLRNRLEALARLDAETRQELLIRIDDLASRIEDDDKLAERVAVVLSDAFRRAEVVDHKALALSVAPLVINTIKTELHNSRDEMVEALYPITGQLVKTYVANAIRDLTEQINRKLEQNAFMVRIQSLLTGRSAADIALAATSDFAFRDIYLVRRGTGALLARWPEHEIEGRDHALSGVLAAINEFANEALGAGNSGLRKIELGDERIYVRASPLHLLAARCTGFAPPAVERLIDDAFAKIIGKVSGAEPVDDQGSNAKQALNSIGQELQDRVQSARALEFNRPAPLRTVAAFLLMPLIGLVAFFAYERWTEERAKRTAQEIIAAQADLRGYPIRGDADAFGSRIAVTGLTPDAASKEAVLAAIRRALPDAIIVDRLAEVRQAPARDLEPEIARIDATVGGLETRLERELHGALIVRDMRRALHRLRGAALDLDSAARFSEDKDLSQTSTTTAKALWSITKRLARATNSDPAEGQGTASSTRLLTIQTSLIDIQEARHALERLIQAPKRGADENGTAVHSDERTTVNLLASEADRVATLSAALALTARGTRGLAQAKTPTAREQLMAIIQNRAIFFTDGNTYLDPDRAQAMIKQIADLLKKADVALRVVGYTDDTGTPAINRKTSEDRAETVRSDLQARGVPASRLSRVGRSASKPIGVQGGMSMKDRRVEFELAFPNEPDK